VTYGAGTADDPSWIQEHHRTEADKNPKEYRFDDRIAALRHYARHTNLISDGEDICIVSKSGKRDGEPDEEQ
jgi:hypothetical protein